jgi:hypothetical protein
MNDEIQKKIAAAGRNAVAFKNMGFHCSESVFMGINETLNIADPAMVKLVTGFHGGGGTHRTEPGVDMTALLAGIAAGTEERPDEEIPLDQVGHLCGAVAAGIICFGFLYGRQSPSDDLTCVDELSYELHRRFMEEFGERECVPLRDTWIPLWPEGTCERVYKRGAEIAVELILTAPELVSECQQKV